MPFRFTYLCELLEKLEQPYREKRFILPKDLKTFTENQTLQWFKNHRDRLNEFATNQDAVMAMLRPETWVGREYLGDEHDLEPFLWRAVQFSRPERVELHKWKTHPSTGDLGAQVGRILGNRGNANNFNMPKDEEVTVEEVDQCLLEIAAHNNKSSHEIQSLRSSCLVNDPDGCLRVICCRLRPQEAKWMTRLLLKRTDPAKVPADFSVTSGHSMLPNCIKVRVELASSSPTTLHIGKTGLVKAKPQLHLPSILRSSIPITRRRSPTLERHGSPETDLRPRKRGRRDSRGLKSMSRSVSRPRVIEQEEIGHALQESIPTPLSSKPKPLPSTSTSSSPGAIHHRTAAKRRRISRETSPGPIVFKKVTRDSLPREKSSQDCHAFQLASSGGGHMVPISNSTSSPAPQLPDPDFEQHDTSKRQKTTKDSPPGNTMDSNHTVPTPASFDLVSQAPPKAMTSDGDTSEHSPASNKATPFQPQDIPKPPIENPHQPTPLTSSNSHPLKTGGPGKCTITPNPASCPLADIIFLPSPHLPSRVQERLTTFLFRVHGASYITSHCDLFHPSLPTRHPSTGRDYMRIILVEPRHEEKNESFMRTVREFLGREEGFPVPGEETIYVYDWRLLEVIGGRERDGRGMDGAWHKCWVGVI